MVLLKNMTLARPTKNKPLYGHINLKINNKLLFECGYIKITFFHEMCYWARVVKH